MSQWRNEQAKDYLAEIQKLIELRELLQGSYKSLEV